MALSPKFTELPLLTQPQSKVCHELVRVDQLKSALKIVLEVIEMTDPSSFTTGRTRLPDPIEHYLRLEIKKSLNHIRQLPHVVASVPETRESTVSRASVAPSPQ